MTVRVIAFARIREIVGTPSERDVAAGTSAGALAMHLAREFPALEPLLSATRFVRNGAFIEAGTLLCDGDELALLPPFGGG